MTGRALAVVAPLVLFAGCVDGQRIRLAAPGPFPDPATVHMPRHISSAPATEETARRVIQIGRKIVDANLDTGLRPTFITVGAPHVEIFHRGGGSRSLQVFITEGLVRRCQDDAQVAAVLCQQLGKAVVEREALTRAEAQERGDDRSASQGVDKVAGGAFGPPDGTHLLEAGKKEQQRRQKKPAATPDSLARRYLARAGYASEALQAVAPLLREAEQTFVIDKHLPDAETTSEGNAAPPLPGEWRGAAPGVRP